MADMVSTFALSWMAVPPVNGGRNGKENIELTDYVLGEIFVHYQMMWIRGSDLVEKLKPLVED